MLNTPAQRSYLHVLLQGAMRSPQTIGVRSVQLVELPLQIQDLLLQLQLVLLQRGQQLSVGLLLLGRQGATLRCRRLGCLGQSVQPRGWLLLWRMHGEPQA